MSIDLMKNFLKKIIISNQKIAYLPYSATYNLTPWMIKDTPIRIAA